jgi:hypothetical protein
MIRQIPSNCKYSRAKLLLNLEIVLLRPTTGASRHLDTFKRKFECTYEEQHYLYREKKRKEALEASNSSLESQCQVDSSIQNDVTTYSSSSTSSSTSSQTSTSSAQESVNSSPLEPSTSSVTLIPPTEQQQEALAVVKSYLQSLHVKNEEPWLLALGNGSHFMMDMEKNIHPEIYNFLKAILFKI